jgi:DNA invertase Pin-like site-specific DNA recombinase
MSANKFIAYYRVSTQAQGRSGLGLDAQREAVRAFLSGGQFSPVAEFTEVESGKNSDRPQLARAMDMARLTGATLVIAKLDRLSRDAHFLLGLEKAGVEFVAADMPNANRLTVRLMAVIAQEEREMIAARTKAALAQAKARGVRLGGWKGGPKVDAALGTTALVARADAFADSVAPIVSGLRGEGLSLAGIASRLSAQGIRTPRGGQWTATAVRNVLARQGGAGQAA